MKKPLRKSSWERKTNRNNARLDVAKTPHRYAVEQQPADR
jgi:hypothetical protein